jgi:hypothetical protein
MDENPAMEQTPKKSTDKLTLAPEGARASSGVGEAGGIERHQFPRLLAFLFFCAGL